jgi:hypothetical protein
VWLVRRAPPSRASALPNYYAWQVRRARKLASALAATWALALAATLLVAPAATAQAPGTTGSCPPKMGRVTAFVGVSAPDSSLTNPTFRACALNALVAAHVGIVRDVFYWAGIELAPGFYDFSSTDQYVADAARHGIQVLPVLLMAPSFRSAAPANPRHGFYPPKDPNDMGAFAAVLAKRYGPDGDFWTQHPDVPKVPIRAWQVWNEPNLLAYWATGPSPAEYAALLKATADGLRSVDPGADVVTAGLPYSKLAKTLTPERFLLGMYAAGAKGSFNTLAVHPYSDTVSRMVVALKRIRRVLKRGGDSGVPIWVTEVGWASSGPKSVFTVNRSKQASLIASTVRTLARARNSIGLRGLVIHTLRDSRPGPNDHDYWGFHAGLFDLRGKAKPALAALRRAAAHVPS